MIKPVCIIQAPFATRSGYGDMSRDIIRHVIAMDRYDVKLISTMWGACPMNALSAANPKDIPLIERTVVPPLQLARQPELFIQISVPNEFQPVAKYNIGITAGIETTACSAEWLQGLNRMDLNLTISEHSKQVLQTTVMEGRDPAGNVTNILKLEKPIEVLHNCLDLNVFKKIDAKDIPVNLKTELAAIKEDFCFLFVGHWLKGNLGEDRKNVGLLVRTFCETFKNKASSNRPALILKTSGASFSVMDREEILAKIRQIRELSGPSAPNVYLLHGELSEEEINGLYNHPKVKVHISFTKGEGFGRPLLESTQSNKPVVASGWSGHLDFLNAKDAILLNGELRNVEAGAIWPGVIIAESQWFNVDPQMASKAMNYVFKNYGQFLDGAYRLAKSNRERFSYDAIAKRTQEIFDQYVPRFAMPVPIQLPKLKKVIPTN